MDKGNFILPDDVHAGGVIFVLVDSHDKHWGVGWRGGHNDTLSAALQVKLWFDKTMRKEFK